MQIISTAELLEILKKHTPPADGDIRKVRADFSALYRRYQDRVKTACTSFLIDRTIPAHMISVPESRPDRTILFFHGGGFSLGSCSDHLGLCRRLGEEAESRVVGIDYRLAPEYPFPAAVEDCIAAYTFLISHGTHPGRLVVCGISAGATLAIVTLILARDRGLPLPAASVCMSPAVDMQFPWDSVLANQETDWITPERLHHIREIYLQGSDPSDPRASPLYADLSGLPPMYIQAGSSEVLIDGIREFVARVRDAGVEAQCDCAKGMFHCWQVFADVLPEGAAAIARIGSDIRRRVE